MKSSIQADGYVLTGGKSRRFGRDKALYETGGRPMALHAADALAGAVGRVSFVGDPAKYRGLGLPVIPDRHPGTGPLGGIVTALHDASCAWILVAACDMPRLSTAPLTSILAAAGRSKAAAVLPRTPDGRLQPLCAAYSKAALAPLEAALLQGTLKVTEALRRIEWRTLPVDDASPFANINRPGDLRAPAAASG